MEQLWAPWRIDYILSPKNSSTCIFCTAPSEDADAENLILYRGIHSYVIMNKYPYNVGHLMIIPYKHISDFTHLTEEEYAEFFLLQKMCIHALQEGLSSSSFNIGMNLGEIAGAGIKDHLHIHVVPRWANDSSFLSVLSDVRTIPEHIRATYAKLQSFFISF